MPNEAPLWLIAAFAVLAWAVLAITVKALGEQPDDI